MAANFPSNPTIGDTVTIGDIKYKRAGTAWNIVSSGIVAPIVQSNNGTIDLSKGNYHKILIDSGNNSVTVSFTNVPSGSSKWFLELNVSDSYTITWPDSVIWDADTAPTTDENQTIILEFYTPDSGTNIYGVESINRVITLPPQAQGSISGYASGGGPSPTTYTKINKFSFTSDGNAANIGDLTVGRRSGAGASSTVSGYTAGGINTASYNTIDKFPFASDGNATDVGDLLTTKWGHGGNTSTESGYATAGYPVSNTIQKFPFASDGNATDVGDLLTTKYSSSSQSSKTDGYNSGGAPNKNTIEKFPFAADANSTDVGDLIGSLSNLSGGQSSDVSGYSSGGFDPVAPGDSDRIEKFPFATDTNATDVGNLTQARRRTGGSSSTESGYVLGGANPGAVNTIDKFPFASDANATDVGDLTDQANEPVGQQV